MNQMTRTARGKQDRPAGPPQPGTPATVAKAPIAPGGGRRRVPEPVGRRAGFVSARFASRAALCALFAAGALMAVSAPSQAATAPGQAASGQISGVVGSIS